MVMMMSIFVMAAAFSADFGRMYLIRAQLQSAADAAAMSAVNAMGSSIGASSKDSGKKFVFIHSAAGRANLDSSIADVFSGTWKQVGGVWTWIPDPDQGWAIGKTSAGETRDAVRVIVRDTVPWTFGRFMGWDKRVLSAEAIAVWGSITSSSCVRPWAIPYQLLLDQLYPPAGTKSASNPADTLTTSDIARLAAMNFATNPETLKVSSNNGYTANGQFYAIDIPPGEYADGTAPAGKLTGANPYRAEESAATCSALAAYYASQGVSGSVGIGDWLNPETGNMQGPTEQGIGGQGKSNPGLCGTTDICDPEVKVVAALWDVYGNSTNGHCSGCYHVKYLAEFTLKGFDTGSNGVLGYFNTMTLPAGGNSGFSPGLSSSLIVRRLVK